RVSEGHAACGAALQRGERVIVEDVDRSSVFADSEVLDVLHRAEVRSVQSTPLLSPAGRLLGVFSTHYSHPHWPSRRELRLLDLLAERAADAILRYQAEGILRDSARRRA